jgi:hypothetical protein
MRTFNPKLSGKGLLAASVALFSGAALAETAGRVTFVNGDVTATTAEGNSRVLRRGDNINGGDKISTRAGRIQIRFTDGGFVSLQPNSVFGVDEYLYTNRKPEESSLFFSLLQGGMRTITGTIGKVNKQSYKVRTPVATIGIRGTEYLASLTDDGLKVSVGSGFVNVENQAGNTTGGAGQNIAVSDENSAPVLSEEKAEVQATGVEGDKPAQEEEEEQVASEDTLDNTVSVGDVLNERGEYIFLFTTEAGLQSSDLVTGTPRYIFNSPKFGLTDNGGDGLLVTFGTPMQVYTAADNADPSAPDFDSGTLQFASTGGTGSLAWGEFTNGDSAVNNVFETCNDGCFFEPVSLTDQDFVPYIVGLAPVSNVGRGTGIYTYQGGTPVRNDFGHVGAITQFVIEVDFDFSTLDLSLGLAMPSLMDAGATNNYSVGTQNGPIAIANLSAGSSFNLDSSVLDVADTDGTCGSGSSFCNANISGFFAGTNSTQIGAAYEINNYSAASETISGVAALGLYNNYLPTAAVSGPGYALTYAKTSSAGSDNAFFGYDSVNGKSALTNTFDTSGTSGMLQADQTTVSGTITRLASDTAQITNNGHISALDWGRWYNGNITVDDVTETLNVTPFQTLHYITGPMTQPGYFSNVTTQYGSGATAVYTFQGGTTATGSDGSLGTITSTSALTVAFFSNPTVTVNLGINMSGGTGNSGLYQINSGPISSNLFSLNQPSFGATNLSVTGSACAVSSGCGATANIHGFFAGAQAQQIGLSYQIVDSGRTVNGVGAFARGTITPPTTLSPVVIDGGLN